MPKALLILADGDGSIRYRVRDGIEITTIAEIDAPHFRLVVQADQSRPAVTVDVDGDYVSVNGAVVTIQGVGVGS